MESRTGASLRTHGLRPLGLPRAIEVRVDAAGLPAEVTIDPLGPRARTHAVERVQEVWRIAEAWWREESIRRTYFTVLVDGGRPVTLFLDEHSLGGAQWYEQHY
jgi:hypothetical protein